MKVSSSEGNNVELGDLNIYTLYVIRVSAENAAGEGPKSALVRARTMEGGKLIKQNVSVRELPVDSCPWECHVCFFRY